MLVYFHFPTLRTILFIYTVVPVRINPLYLMEAVQQRFSLPSSSVHSAQVSVVTQHHYISLAALHSKPRVCYFHYF